MQSKSMLKVVLAIVLCASLLATGCSAQWISVALADLPVLAQMALNIAGLVGALQSGNQLSAGEAVAIQNISAQAEKDLQLLQTLYDQYKASPNANTLQEIQSAIADIDQNLPALLAAAHISDPVLGTRISAAVNLILSTVQSFAALIPQAGPVAAHKVSAAVPSAKILRKRWNEQVCAPTGNSLLDAALARCALK